MVSRRDTRPPAPGGPLGTALKSAGPVLSVTRSDRQLLPRIARILGLTSRRGSIVHIDIDRNGVAIQWSGGLIDRYGWSALAAKAAAIPPKVDRPGRPHKPIHGRTRPARSPKAN